MSDSSSRLAFVPWIKRTDLACSHCRRRRVKCKISKDNPQEPCERCVKRQLCCQYMSVAEQEQEFEMAPAPQPLPSSTPTPGSYRGSPRHSDSHFMIGEYSEGDLQEYSNCSLRSGRPYPTNQNPLLQPTPPYPTTQPAGVGYYYPQNIPQHSNYPTHPSYPLPGYSTANTRAYLSDVDASSDPWAHPDVWETLGISPANAARNKFRSMQA
ncbi:hypothetical protein R3P38DRAFT_305443 [Favolaschia claudopus]|uniref:Zn(2)-C6 fungal-type domain-containing protein n=1 Tax=Favolaschia claudopus TaxID=2862362 RepID=A0AAW0CUJ4_9AGAR